MLAAQAVAEPEEQGGGLDEIIVTAQRRSERLQDVPAAIISQTGAQLEKAAIFNIRDLTQLAPGVQIAGTGLNTAPSIRGVFSGQSDPGNDGNIAIYIDDVYQASQAGNSVDFPDLERVEILKGPQGTLFGRNAAGGAIRMFTVGPNMDHYTGQATIGVTTFNGYVAKGYVAGPIIQDVLAFSFSASAQHDDGYHRDIVNNTGDGGRISRTARAKLEYTPTSNLKFELFANFNYHQDNDIQAYQAWNGSDVVRLVNPAAVIPSGTYNYTSNAPPVLWNQRTEAGGKVTVSTDWGDISELTAWSLTHVYYSDDADFTNFNLLLYPAHQNQNDTQSELLFNSKKFGDFQFTVGGNYYQDTGCYCALNVEGASFGANPLVGWSRQSTYAWAGFMDGNYDLTDRLTLSAGVRYTSEKRVGNGDATFQDTQANEPFLGAVVFNDTSPRGSIKYRFTDEDDNVYYTFSRGFKAGGFNISGGQKTPFQPEKIKAHEVGIKTSPSRVVSANVSVFYYDYSNQQVENITGFTNTVSNAAHSRMYGFDGDFIGRVTSDFTVDFSLAYLQANYLSFPPPAAVIILTPNCNCGGVNSTANLSGHSEPFAPTWTFGLGADYHHTFGFGQTDLAAHVYRSDSFIWTSQLESLVNPAYTTVALTASYTPTGSNFSFEAWGKNLTSAKYYASTFISNVSPGVSYVAPREAGFNVKYAF
jgi:iron complex outermembrane recepter protein